MWSSVWVTGQPIPYQHQTHSAIGRQRTSSGSTSLHVQDSDWWSFTERSECRVNGGGWRPCGMAKGYRSDADTPSLHLQWSHLTPKPRFQNGVALHCKQTYRQHRRTTQNISFSQKPPPPSPIFLVRLPPPLCSVLCSSETKPEHLTPPQEHPSRHSSTRTSYTSSHPRIKKMLHKLASPTLFLPKRRSQLR